MPRPHRGQSYPNFLKSFSQRIYFSYRKQFEPLNGLTRSGDPITSDCGWGCMIRCAQMLLAQTLLSHLTHPMNSPYSTIQISEKCKATRRRIVIDSSSLCSQVQNEIQSNTAAMHVDPSVAHRSTAASFDCSAIVPVCSVHWVFIGKECPARPYLARAIVSSQNR